LTPPTAAHTMAAMRILLAAILIAAAAVTAFWILVP
jgi:hypothetical protein